MTVNRAKPEFTPLGFIASNIENGELTCMVLCRAPANDGWLVIESGTGIIYNLFDTVGHKYTELDSKVTATHKDLNSRASQSALLARAQWFHNPKGAEYVVGPRRRRRRVAA